MASLSKEIEAYLKRLLDEEAGRLEIQRSVLSEVFSCVPSQINYVLSTRFTIDKGYLVESKRGGGGYVRITSIPFEEQCGLFELSKNLKDELNEQEAKGVLSYLFEEQVIGEDFKTLISGLLSEGHLAELASLNKTTQIRAIILKHLLARIALLEK